MLRLIATQADKSACGFWRNETFHLESSFDQDSLQKFFSETYEPTPIVAPWNGGSGFYPKDNQEGIDAITASSSPRFARYRDAIQICRSLDAVQAGKGTDEEERRTTILRECRNRLPDACVEWLDAAVGIAADGSRSFAPVLGTGGNEGRLDYTNNFMSRVASLLITSSRVLAAASLLSNALLGTRTTNLQSGAAGQYDPGRAGGANQGQGIETDSITNPWDLILTMEGAVTWASGLYRRQGVHYRSVLCSPFTVRTSRIGYGSSSPDDDSRAEVWAPLWSSSATYSEVKYLLREGRASIEGRPAKTALEFAQAVCSLGVDRGINSFVRYSLLKRRGDSYVALPAGTFPVKYRSEGDLVRHFQSFYTSFVERGLPPGAQQLQRGVDAALYDVLLKGGHSRMRELMAAFGRVVRRTITTAEKFYIPFAKLPAAAWLNACGFDSLEVRIAAALASLDHSGICSLSGHLSRQESEFAWSGGSLAERMASVLSRRLQRASALGLATNPLGGQCALDPGDVTPFIEGAVHDDLVEDLVFAFALLDWKNFRISELQREQTSPREILPVYAILKHLFLPGEIRMGDEPKTIRADSRILPLLRTEEISDAAGIACHRLIISGFHPRNEHFQTSVDSIRLAASLLLPVKFSRSMASTIFDLKENETK